MKPLKYGPIVLSLVLFIVIWQMYATHFGHALVFPPPRRVFSYLGGLLLEGQTYQIIGRTLGRLSLAFLFSAGIAYFSGLMAAQSCFFEGLLRPWVIGLRTLPVVSVIVIVLVIFSRHQAVYVIAFLMLFPLIYEATKQSVLHMPVSLKDALTLEPSNLWFKTMYIHIPLSAPYVKTAALQSIGLGFKVLIMAEFISQLDQSIGRMLYLGSESIDYAPVFAWTVIIIVIVALLETLVQRLKTI